MGITPFRWPENLLRQRIRALNPDESDSVQELVTIGRVKAEEFDEWVYDEICVCHIAETEAQVHAPVSLT